MVIQVYRSNCSTGIHVIDDGDEVQLSAKASVYWPSMCVINNLVQLPNYDFCPLAL